jgi:hypothetical protein
MGYTKSFNLNIPNAMWLILALVAAAPSWHCVRAAEVSAVTLDEACKSLASVVTKTIEQGGLGRTVTVGAFPGVPRLESSGGVGLALRIKHALESEFLAVQRNGAVQVSGEFKDSTATLKSLEADMVVLRIEYRIRDAKDIDLAKGVINVFEEGPLEIAGTTIDLSAPVTTKEQVAAQQRNLADSFQTPRAAIVGNETRPNAESRFGLGVQVRRQGDNPSVARKPQLRDGRAFVQMNVNEEYSLRVRNGSDKEVLVSITIDGLDAFTFSEDPIDKGRKVHLVVPAGGTIDVPGWYITPKKSRAFRITSYADSEAARLFGDSESIGQITATFYESIRRPLMQERVGTGKGGDIQTNYQLVLRDEGRPLASITVRYEKAVP